MSERSPSIEAICRMPEDFRRRGDVSMIKLLEESGYLNAAAQMTEDTLRRYVAAHPDTIDSWAGFSEDERASEGWYLLRPQYPEARGSWVVGFHPSGPRKSYSSGAEACAAYIKRYVDDLSKYVKHAN